MSKSFIIDLFVITTMYLPRASILMTSPSCSVNGRTCLTSPEYEQTSSLLFSELSTTESSEVIAQTFERDSKLPNN